MPRQSKDTVAILGIDIGKNTFHLVGFKKRGAIVLRQKLSRRAVSSSRARWGVSLFGSLSGSWGKISAMFGSKRLTMTPSVTHGECAVLHQRITCLRCRNFWNWHTVIIGAAATAGSGIREVI